jgi:hypothetical protein
MRFTVQLSCLNPFWREEYARRDDIAAWVGDFEFELEIPIDEGIEMGHREPSLIYNVYNDGDTDTGMTLEIRAVGAASDPEIINVDTGRFIGFHGLNLISGDVLTVGTSYGKKNVTLLPIPQKLKDIIARLKGDSDVSNLNADITREDVMTMDTPVEPLKNATGTTGVAGADGAARIINKELCPDGLKNNPNRKMEWIGHVTIHTTANYTPTATAKNHADYVYNGSGGTRASWHYTIDANEIWQSFDDNRVCWHAGSTEGNETSIGVEICVNDKTTFRRACENAAWLTAELLKRHGLGLEHVVQHKKWSGKNCPAELISGEWGVNWQDFIQMTAAYFVGELAPDDETAPDESVPNDVAKASIAGQSALTAEQLTAFLFNKNTEPKINCPALELAGFFIAEGGAEGIRGDIAFCQALLETGWFRFGGQVLPEQNNFCGLGAVNSGAIGMSARFDTPQSGVRAQIQHLKAYANAEPLVNERVDPRFSLVTRGSAPCWEDLNGRWAVPGGEYGQNILRLYGEAVEMTENMPSTGQSSGGQTSDETKDATVSEAINVLAYHGVTLSPEYWLENYAKLDYLDNLLINMASRLKGD